MTGCQVEVGYWLHEVVTEIQVIYDAKLKSGACWVIDCHKTEEEE